MIDDKIKWCIDQHKNSNHMYSEYLPYEFHLRMVAHVGEKYKHLLDNTKDYFTGDLVVNPTAQVTTRNACMIACWGHDLIEDCRVSYNDVKDVLGQEAAEIIYALTNEKGRNRKERANEKYYDGIRNTRGAVFVKLCDRIANVQYSKMTGSRMFKMYMKENVEFTKSLGLRGDIVDFPGHEYYQMYKYLNDLFKN
jgi:(p)ppGpp synthase/HD superfamily hydrolase